MRLIDADELHEEIWSDNNGCLSRIESVAQILLRIESAHTIDAQPVKRGKWVEYSRNALETYIECTNCCVASRPIHLQMVTKNGSGLPDYCPNCGARMEVDEDEQAQ